MDDRKSHPGYYQTGLQTTEYEILLDNDFLLPYETFLLDTYFEDTF
jgi:hypothetical protein